MRDELTRIAEALERIANVLTPSVQPPYIEPQIWATEITRGMAEYLDKNPIRAGGWLSPTASRGD